MRYEYIAGRFLLALTALLWTGVLCAELPLQPDDPKDKDLSLNIVPAPSPKMSSIWLDLNDDLVSCICQFYGPVRFNASDRNEIGKVLKVLTTLSRLFEHLKYVGTIEVDEVLAYYLLLLELSFVKKRYPDKLERKLMKWPLPKGNLTLSLLISNGPICESTLQSLASYLTYISDKSARLAAINYCLDRCASGSMYLDDVSRRILLSASEPCVVSKWKRILRRSALSSDLFNVDIAGCLLHFAPVERGEALIDDLRNALAVVANRGMFAQFCAIFIRYPTTLRDQDSMQVIFKRNIQEFQAIPFTAEQWTVLSVINKIRFGAPQDIKDTHEAEREKLFAMFRKVEYLALVFHVWAREDVSADVWGQFANDPSNTSTLSRLAFDLEGFFKNCFDANLFRDDIFTLILKDFRYYPNSRKKQQFLTLLREKVQNRPDVVKAVFWDDVQAPPYMNEGPFRCQVEFFVEQDDKAGLQALSNIISQEIASAPSTELALNHYGIVRICQCLGGGVDGPLQLLAERIGGAKVLDCLDFSRIRANDMGEMLSILGIEWDQMNAALASLSDTAASGDELAKVLRGFRDSATNVPIETLSSRHALWFYLWEQHRAAFVEHVDHSIQQHYLPEESKLPEPVR